MRLSVGTHNSIPGRARLHTSTYTSKGAHAHTMAGTHARARINAHPRYSSVLHLCFPRCLRRCLNVASCVCANCGSSSDVPTYQACGPPISTCSASGTGTSGCWGSLNGQPGTCDCRTRSFAGAPYCRGSNGAVLSRPRVTYSSLVNTA